MSMAADYYSQACVGSQDGEDQSRVWFSRWFLDRGYFDAPACIWQRDGRKITKTYKPEYGRPDVPQRIWILTDEYDKHGRRLGAWPD